MANINCQETLKHLLLQGNRIDGRELFQNRDLEILFGTTSTGSVEVSLGQSKVFTTTKALIVSPSPARPSEGMLKFRVDIQLLNEDGQGKNKIQQGINPSDSRKYQMEIEKILERMIKNSKSLDVESLCIQQGKSVWSITVECVVVINQGNLIDAIYYSCILSLLHFRRPQVQILPFQGVKVFTQEEKRFMPLSIHHIPLTFTFAILEDKENSAVCIDPQYEEEMICKGRITIGLNIYGDICYIHKPGGLPISSKLLSQIIQVSQQKAQSTTGQFRSFLENYNSLNFTQNKVSQTFEVLFNFNLISHQSEQNIIDAKELENCLSQRINQE